MPSPASATPTFRTMNVDDLSHVLGWAAAEGWNPGVDDAPAFLAADPEGFFLAEVDGTTAAAISVVNHTDTVAFLGLYICQPAYRGQGIGYALWQHAIAHAGARTVGLDGVPAQQDNYRKSGFVYAGETRRHEGLPAPQKDAEVRAAQPADIPALDALEAEATGYAKPRLAPHWFAPTATRHTMIIDGSDGIDGVATLRQCRQGAKLGPLVARDLETATRLLHHAAAIAPDGPLVVDIPASMAPMAELCAAEGMTVSFETARMYRGPAPTPGPHIHTASTLELG